MTTESHRCAVIGAGRLGGALAAALSHAGWEVTGPLGRDADIGDAEIVLLCVPDDEIAAAAAAVPPHPGLLVGHCSGATTLAPLAPHEGFSLHPLMTVPTPETSLAGAPVAIAASGVRGLRAAQAIALAAEMAPFSVDDSDRAAYHAAASIASNFLMTLEWMATEVGQLDRALLVPLVRASVESWAELGPEGALTGPVSRGDAATVQRQRSAISDRHPDFLPLFNALVERTEALSRLEVPA